MALAIQYDLFESNDEENLQKKEIALLHGQVNNLRRGLFARFGTLEKNYIELKQENEELKALIKSLTKQKAEVFSLKAG